MPQDSDVDFLSDTANPKLMTPPSTRASSTESTTPSREGSLEPHNTTQAPLDILDQPTALPEMEASSRPRHNMTRVNYKTLNTKGTTNFAILDDTSSPLEIHSAFSAAISTARPHRDNLPLPPTS